MFENVLLLINKITFKKKWAFIFIVFLSNILICHNYNLNGWGEGVGGMDKVAKK